MAVIFSMSCCCQRGMLCCDKCSSVKKALELELREAMDTGDWTTFESLREEFEQHMGGARHSYISCASNGE